MKKWTSPPALRGNQLFPQAALLEARESVLGPAFADAAKTRTLLTGLRGATPNTRLNLPTAVGASAALAIARPAVPRAAISGVTLADLGVNLAGIQEAMWPRSESVRKTMERFQASARAWSAPLGELATGIQALIEEQRQMDTRTDEFVRRHGWPVPHLLPNVSYRRVVALADADKRTVNRLMVDVFRPGTKAYLAARSAIDSSSAFEARRPLLRQVWRAQSRGDWYLVISGLLPLVEGVLLDEMFPTGTRPKKVKPGVERLASDVETPGAAGAVKAAETLLLSAGGGSALFDSYDPPAGVEPRSLNRHAVLHGVARRYGTEQNATKLFLLLVLMAECLEFKREASARKDRRRRSKAA